MNFTFNIEGCKACVRLSFSRHRCPSSSLNGKKVSSSQSLSCGAEVLAESRMDLPPSHEKCHSFGLKTSTFDYVLCLAGVHFLHMVPGFRFVTKTTLPTQQCVGGCTASGLSLVPTLSPQRVGGGKPEAGRGHSQHR